MLTLDFKIFAKVLANHLKHCIHKLIHSDQSGFLEGRNIGNYVHLILDIIDYMDNNDIPDAIIIFDIEKESPKHSNFGDQFISWIETIYS